MSPKKVKISIFRKCAVVAGAALAITVGATATAKAHHSYAMYDGSVYRVFTGVMVRVIPNAAHFELHFVPMNEQRDALVRDEDGEPVVWVAQMESAAEAARHGITRDAFSRGAVISIGLHPRRDGKPAGDRGESGLYRCPENQRPAPGMHCDAVEGSTSFGPSETLPQEGSAG